MHTSKPLDDTSSSRRDHRLAESRKKDGTVQGKIHQRACVFDHIQKTGGTAWISQVQRNFPDHRVSPLILHEDIAFAERITETYDFVGGHLNLSPDYHWPPDIFHMTMVREPVDRFLSHFYYVRTSESASEPFAELARSHELGAALELRHPTIEAYIKNFYVRHFLEAMYRPAEVERLLATESFSVDEIAAFVIDRYDLVGLTEFIDLTSDCFSLQMDGATGRSVPFERVTTHRPRIDDVDPAILATLRRLSAADRALYNTLHAAFFATVRHAITATTETRRISRSQPHPIPEPPHHAPQPQPCTLAGIDIFCPTSPANDRVRCGEPCTLSAVFHLSQPATSLELFLTLRNHLRQVAFRDSITIEVPQGPEPQRAEVMWNFLCALGEGTYDCDIVATAHGAPGHPSSSAYFNHAYQFGVLAPRNATAAGQTWLAPTVSTAIGPIQPGTLEGRIHLPSREITAAPGERLRIPLTFHNAGRHAWPSAGFNRVVAGLSITPVCHPAEFDSATRHPLAHDLAPGEERTLQLVVTAPAEPGDYVIWIGLVQEWITWFCLDQNGIALSVNRP